MAECFPNYHPGNRIQFQVGVADSYISNKIDISKVEIPDANATQMVINVANIIDDTFELWSDGELRQRDITNWGESYGVFYAADKVTVNYFEAFRQDQIIVIRFEYTS